MESGNIEIRKRKGIDSLVSGYTPGKVEEKKETCVVGECDYLKLFKKYINTQPLYPYLKLLLSMGSYTERVKYIDEILTPSEICSFVNLIEVHPHGCSGLFISRLIQNSYDAGYNDFSLNTQNLKLEYLGAELCGSKNKKISLSIEGDAGYECGLNAKHIHLTLHGDAGTYLGHRAVRSIFTIHGLIQRPFGYASSGCVFRTSNKKTLRELTNKVWTRRDGKSSGTTVALIHPDGMEEVMEITDGMRN